MAQYIALLRGINVSGKNKIAMPLLKKAFEDIGFLEVQTYINSGNVIFSTELCDKDMITERCKAIIEERFVLEIPVAIVSGNALSEALENAPEWWDKPSDQEMIHQAIFLIPPVTIEEVYHTVGETRVEFEKVAYYGSVIFWSAPRATLPKTRWYKISNTAVNRKVTIRNANTTKKLASLLR